MKYGKIVLKIQEFTNFGISAVTFEPYIIESFCELCCVRRPSKPRYRAQIYCSILTGFVVMGISNMVKYDDFDFFGHIWSTHKILFVHHRAINLGSIPRFWGSTNAAFFDKSFYRGRLKSYGRIAKIGKFLNSEAIFAKFQMAVKC